MFTIETPVKEQIFNFLFETPVLQNFQYYCQMIGNFYASIQKWLLNLEVLCFGKQIVSSCRVLYSWNSKHISRDKTFLRVYDRQLEIYIDGKHRIPCQVKKGLPRFQIEDQPDYLLLSNEHSITIWGVIVEMSIQKWVVCIYDRVKRQKTH